MPKQIVSFRQFSGVRRFLLRFGFDTKTTPFDSVELCLLADLLGIEARDLGVASGGQDEKAIVRSAESIKIGDKAQLQKKVRDELRDRKHALTAFCAVVCAVVSVLAAIVAAVSSHASAKASSQSAATAQTAVNVIIGKPVSSNMIPSKDQGSAE